MDNKISKSIQEYLKQIYKLNQAGGAASNTELAARSTWQLYRAAENGSLNMRFS